MKVNKKVLILAIILGLFTVGAVYYYISDLNKKEETPVDLTDVVVAADTIPTHVKITEEMLTTVSVPTEAVHPNAILTKEKAVGGITSSEIIKGEQLLSDRVVTDGTAALLSYSVPETMRAITIPMNEISGVGGYIEAGDRIDILVSYADTEINPTKVVYTQLQNIEVLVEGPAVASTEEAQTGVPTSLTVLVTPAQAEVLAFAYVNGGFHYTLRNPIDNTKADLQLFGTENFSTWRDR